MPINITFFFNSKRINKIIFFKKTFFILLLFFAFSFLAFSADARINNTDEILVKYNNGKIKTVEAVGSKISDCLNEYNNKAEVEYTEPNYLYRAAVIPSDTYYKNQWYLDKIEAPQAWDIARESPEIIIAVIDSGVQINHPDLAGNIWQNSKEIAGNSMDDDKNGFIDDINGWDFVNNTSDPGPKFSPGFTQDGILHGTIVAGVAAGYGNNGIGISGVAWQAKIMPLKVLDDKGEGNTLNVIKAIDYAILNKADIINLSFVGEGFSRSLEDAIRRAYIAGIIIIAAAGNDQGDGEGNDMDKIPMYPACHDGNPGENMVIGVAASDPLDQKAIFSSYGFNCVDIVAPGQSIFSTSVYSPVNNTDDISFSKYYEGYWSGTSMAAPIVSGAVALIETINPRLSQSEIINVLFNNTDDINRLNPDYLGRLGAGRINVYKSVKAAKIILDKFTTKLIVAPYKDFMPNVNLTGQDGIIDQSYLVYDKNFRGGVNVAAGDIDGDGIDEIVTGAGFTGGPQVRIFGYKGNVKQQFFAYDNNFRGGVKVGIANYSRGAKGKGYAIITAPGKGEEPLIKIFNYKTEKISSFYAYDKKFKEGVNIAAGDVDNDGLDEIITGAGPGGASHVRIFNNKNTLMDSFYAFPIDYKGGVNVAAINY
ncbi:hypothetical protein DRH27_05690 [Candidatus Falkowbacteria bacterium]|nr:MAG: hypothetical protein DRH27_05690 [Candidatus Falkowbacteria bacterium]